MSQRAKIDYRTVLASALNTATYVPVGLPMTVQGKIAVITTTVNANILLSWDGITDHLFIENGATTIGEAVRTLDFGATDLVAPGRQLYAKLVTATAAGSVFVTYFG